MKHISLALILLTATAACNGATTPTEVSPSFDANHMGSGAGRDDGGHIGSGVGAQSQDDGSGSTGSGCCLAGVSADGSVMGSGGRTGLIGPTGG